MGGLLVGVLAETPDVCVCVCVCVCACACACACACGGGIKPRSCRSVFLETAVCSKKLLQLLLENYSALSVESSMS